MRKHLAFVTVHWHGMSMVAAAIVLACGSSVAAAPPILVLPARETTLEVAVDLPSDVKAAPGSVWQLVEVGSPATVVAADLVPSVSDAGVEQNPRGCLVAIVPPATNTNGARRFELQSALTRGEGDPSPLRFDDITDKTVQLTENGKPVFAYNHGMITDESVPETDHRRSCGSYIHPVWGLSGEVLTATFPPDHYHHHGIFWTWKDVEIEGRHYNHWEYTNIRTRFVRWLDRQTTPIAAVLAVENGWFADTGKDEPEKVMIERVWLRTFRSDGETRALDIRLTLVPADKPITLAGAGGKSYGGLTMRFDGWPRTDVTVRAPGETVEDVGRTGLVARGDLAMKPLPWADLASQFPGVEHRSGAAVFVHPSHPNYPPTWLTRCYGPLCVGWPGVNAQTFEPGKPITLRYRVWIHKAEVGHDRLEQAYRAYTAATEAAWDT